MVLQITPIIYTHPVFTSQQGITSQNTAIFHVVKNMLENSVSSPEAARNYPPLLDYPFTLRQQSSYCGRMYSILYLSITEYAESRHPY
jgi:hypothetical protein